MAQGALTYTHAPGGSGAAAACGLYGVYGARLTWFLLRRQSSAQYHASEHGRELGARMAAMAMAKRCFITTMVPVTQVLCMYGLQPLVQDLPVPAWAGLGVAAAGLALEAVADEQKLAAKEAQPN